MFVVTCAAVGIAVVVGVVVSDCAVGSVVGNNAMIVDKSDTTSNIVRFCGCAAILVLLRRFLSPVVRVSGNRCI